VGDGTAPFHAHVYYSSEERPAAERLRETFAGQPGVLFIGQMTDRGVGPHPIPQYEVHFREVSRPSVVAAIEASGLRALVHPLTNDEKHAAEQAEQQRHRTYAPASARVSKPPAPGDDRLIQEGLTHPSSPEDARHPGDRSDPSELR